MGRIIRFNPDRHEETRSLLPWYVTGQLDEDEHARVEAHLHDCAECQAELRLEQRLAGAVADLPLEVDEGWSALRDRLEAETAPFGRLRRAFALPARAGWAVAAQFLLVVALVGGLALPLAAPARYHTLSAPAPKATGDLIVIFQPDARAAELTRVLRETGARLVDGPTAADAYVLDAPAAHRAETLRRLRADAAVAMAEPIDSAEPQ